MIALKSSQVLVYIAVGNVDMRKSIDGLSILVSQQFALDPFAGHLFAFSNRRRTVVKILYWDRNGFALWQKRLERERFRWPESRDQVIAIGYRELRWLLDGLEIQQRHAHRALNYSVIF
jgi:transposase